MNQLYRGFEMIQHNILESPIDLGDGRILTYIGSSCVETYPCWHWVKVEENDGSIIEEELEGTNIWDEYLKNHQTSIPDSVLEHFGEYDEFEMSWLEDTPPITPEQLNENCIWLATSPIKQVDLTDELGPIEFPENAPDDSREALESLASGGPGFVSYPLSGEEGENIFNCKGKADLIHSIECDKDIHDVNLLFRDRLYNIYYSESVQDGSYKWPIKSFRLTDHLEPNKRLVLDSTGFPIYNTSCWSICIGYRASDAHTFRMNQSFVYARNRRHNPVLRLLGKEITMSVSVDGAIWE
jgi:hypothetical protein